MHVLFNKTTTTDLYTLSLHDALPISLPMRLARGGLLRRFAPRNDRGSHCLTISLRSEEHTSELQSHHDLVCRLLLEKKHMKNKVDSSHKVPREMFPVECCLSSTPDLS